MFETLKRMYEQGKINESKLTSAVLKGWITLEQKAEIVSDN